MANEPNVRSAAAASIPSLPELLADVTVEAQRERRRAEAAERRLAEIRALVDEQAEDEGLWALYPMGEQPIMEAYLQQELRRLHALVEGVTP